MKGGREAGIFVFDIRQGVTSRDVLFQKRIAEGAETDQRGAASPHAQEILCRSFTRPAGLWVSALGICPHAQGSISSRHILMMEKHSYRNSHAIRMPERPGGSFWNRRG